MAPPRTLESPDGFTKLSQEIDIHDSMYKKVNLGKDRLYPTSAISLLTPGYLSDFRFWGVNTDATVLSTNKIKQCAFGKHMLISVLPNAKNNAIH